jgi:hypothetical protein
VIQSQGVTRITASCGGESGRVDFGDGALATVSRTTGPITHADSSTGVHQVTLTCTNGLVTSSNTAIVGGVSGSRARTTCLGMAPAVALDAVERWLIRIGFDICRR